MSRIIRAGYLTVAKSHHIDKKSLGLITTRHAARLFENGERSIN
jgi:hypothetical protein